MADRAKCTGSGVRIRSGPGLQYNQIGTLYKGDEVNVINREGDWWEHTSSGHWTSSKYLQMIQTDTENNGDTTSPPASNVTEQAKEDIANYDERNEVDLSELVEERLDDYPDEETTLLDMVYDEEEYLNSLEDSLSINNIRGIHGMPYQFLPIVDNRINNKQSSFGRKYAEKIVARMPLLLLTPGVPKFMSGYKEDVKRNVIEKLIMHSNSHLEELISGNSDGRYYTFKPEYKLYYDYVNTALKAVAIDMGLGDESINGHKLGGFDGIWGDFDWGNDVGSDASKLIRFTKCVPFYINSDKQISESYSNETGESMLKSGINGLSDYARELQFMLGTTSYALKNDFIGRGADALARENLSQSIENVNDFINTITLGNGGIFTRITSNIQTIVAGGKLIFPEIWSDSSMGGRSYDINIKLVCPDPNPLNLFLDIMVPIIHLLCACAPRSATANGYVAPFLVRAFYKGMFNVNMGLITSLNITKGAEGSWSREGIPTVADVSFTIKDLYSSLTISKNESNESGIINNLALMDYLANMCGINVNDVDIYSQVVLYAGLTGVSRWIDNLRFDIFRGMEQWASTLAYDIYSKIFR